MAGLHPRDEVTELPKLRREVIVPKARDAFAFHRRIALLSIFVALLAGSLDAMLWRDAQRNAERARARYNAEVRSRTVPRVQAEDGPVVIERSAPAVTHTEGRHCARRHRHAH